MRDKELYAQILGIKPPWIVREVELALPAGEVIVHLDLDSSSPLTCPVCGEVSPGYDTRPRRWRHLDTCQYHTVIAAEVPRVECSEHGVHQITVPWAEPGGRFSALFEALAIDWMKETSLSGVCRLLALSWDEAAGIQKRAVKRGPERRELDPLTRIGIDETSFQKRHEYVTVVSDQDSGDVIYVADDRRRESLEGFYETLNEEELGGLESVSMDMWPAYIGTTLKYVPGAEEKIAFDKFHVAKHLGDAVDKVRRREHRDLTEAGRSDLTGTKYLWLRNPEKMSPGQWSQMKSLRHSTLRTAEAWSVKELAMSLWNYSSRSWARKAWQQCIFWAKETGLRPVIEVAAMLERHLEGILNAIVLGATNGRAEGINSRIQWIKKMACGFRNRERFRHAILFHLRGLDLYPASVRTS